MSKLGYARMPYIGSRVVDSAGVALIEEWIASLPHAIAIELVSAPATADSAAGESLAIAGQREKPPAANEQADDAIGELRNIDRGRAGRSLLRCIAARCAARTLADGRLCRRTLRPSDIRGLFETFVPESKRRATLGANIDPQVILSRQGRSASAAS